MFKSAFISEYSLNTEGDIGLVLKSHLLSNSEVIIPAAAMRHEAVAQMIDENLLTLSNGEVKLAHGTDCEGLSGYMEKYPETHWSPFAKNSMREFQNKSNIAVYDISNTFEQFNAIMRKCAKGEIDASKDLFNNYELNRAILESSNRNLFEYFEIANRHIGDRYKLKKMNSYLKYIYNLCGALSTNSGNTFSLENSSQFNYITHQSGETQPSESGLSLLISCALDVTEGIEDFSFLGDLSKTTIENMSFKDVLEVRNEWLHGRIIKAYEEIVQTCVEAMVSERKGDLDAAIIHIEKAYELRAEIVINIRSRIKTEINAYKVHRISRFLADSAIQMASFFSGVSLVQSIAHAIYGATTEVAVIANKETQLKKLVAAKSKKITNARNTAEVLLSAKSPTLEYLRSIDNKLAG